MNGRAAARIPRIVETKDGRYFLYYTSYNGKVALLCCAESTDLVHWEKARTDLQGCNEWEI